MLLDFLFNRARELIIYGMTRLRGDNTSQNGLAHQSQITNDIEKFMTCRLVVPCQGLVINVSQTSGIHMRNAKGVSKFIITILWQFFLINHDGIVKVTTLYKSQIQQWFNLTYKDKSTCRSNLCWEICNIIQISKLVIQNL